MKIFLDIITLSFWPISLYLANTKSDFIQYLLPALIVSISFVIYKKSKLLSVIPILFITVIEPKLALFPIFFMGFQYILFKEKKYLICVLASLLFFTYSYNSFKGQAIFVSDHEAKQQVVRDSTLYPSIFLARTFHNKARIIADKYIFNFFALIDPNNYFFGFHPRQLVGGQNLAKFPFLNIIPLLYGVYYLGKYKYKSFTLITIISGVMSLSFLINFDRNDFLLWIPISMIILHGLVEMMKNKIVFKIYILSFLILVIPEIVRIFIK